MNFDDTANLNKMTHEAIEESRKMKAARFTSPEALMNDLSNAAKDAYAPEYRRISSVNKVVPFVKKEITQGIPQSHSDRVAETIKKVLDVVFEQSGNMTVAEAVGILEMAKASVIQSQIEHVDQST